MKRCLAAGVVLAGAFASAPSEAATCVATTVVGKVLADRGRARFVEQLAASLAQHEIAMCRGGETPIAEVAIEASDAGTATVHVRDAVTRKDVVRLVRTGAIPSDGRPLALAIAADELLRASWAEILLARAPAPPPEPPPQVRAVVEASLPLPLPPPAAAPRALPQPAREPAPTSRDLSAPSPDAVAPASAPHLARVFLGAAPAGERATGGLALGGVDARLGFYPLDRLALSVRIGGRAALSASATDGSTSASAFVGGLGAAVALLPRGRTFELEIPVRVDVDALEFSAHPSAGARGSDGSAVAVVASVGVAASVRFAAAWRVELEGTVGAP